MQFDMTWLCACHQEDLQHGIQQGQITDAHKYHLSSVIIQGKTLKTRILLKTNVMHISLVSQGEEVNHRDIIIMIILISFPELQLRRYYIFLFL